MKLTGWTFEPGVIVPLLLCVALYARGLSSFRRRNSRRSAGIRDLISFAAGCLVVVLALVSPLDAASDDLFSAHMIQHELLMVLAAPLFVVGRPGFFMLWAMRGAARFAVVRALRSRLWRTGERLALRPIDAWLAHALVLWGWHVPALFQAAVHSTAIHAVQHLSFLGTAMLFWSAMMRPRRRASRGLSIVYLFTTAIHTAGLGALMTFARSPWYPVYASTTQAWGLTPMDDQRLAGLVMWIPASLAYLLAALMATRTWLSESEWRVARAERALSIPIAGGGGMAAVTTTPVE